MAHYYFSLQYSAVQKTILRHDRLWSMAGISQILSYLNEIKLPQIAKSNSGTVIVAGGGKFTARFDDKNNAENAKKEIIKIISTTLPMLEFQSSTKIIEAQGLKDAKDKLNLINELNEQKRTFRGYGVIFNPHLKVCGECGEYPAIEGKKIGEEEVCSVCKEAHEARNDKSPTTIKNIYESFLKNKNAEIPLDFKDLFPKDKERKRLAVWFSDLNNMNDKVPLWLSQDREENILKTFNKVKEENIYIIANALKETFKENYLPFRIIVAGGDDLCIVMDSKYILDFVLNLSENLNSAISKLDSNHPLNIKWLQNKENEWAKQKNDETKTIQPYCFGGSFVVTSIHTPFKRIHSVGEELMKIAKNVTDRKANSVNWRIMAEYEEDTVSERYIDFEKPIYIEDPNGIKKDNPIPDRLSFKRYVELARFYSKHISNSHIQQIISAIIEHENDNKELEDCLKRYASRELEKGFSFILVDDAFRKNGLLDCSRIASLFELMSIL